MKKNLRSGTVGNNFGKLYFMCGLPCSGKSTIANNWIRNQFEVKEQDVFNGYVMENKNPRIILGGDDFRQALTGQEFQIAAEGTVCAMIDVAAKASILRGFDTIVDDTHTTEASLLRMYRIDIDAERILIDTPKEVCIERAIKANREYLCGPIERMSKQLDYMKENWETIRDRVRGYLINRKKDDII